MYTYLIKFGLVLLYSFSIFAVTHLIWISKWINYRQVWAILRLQIFSANKIFVFLKSFQTVTFSETFKFLPISVFEIRY